jgi:ribosome biogenesis GTPase A
MHKAQERLKRELQTVDLVLEVRDARVPRLSGNSELQEIIGQRRKVILFNKSQLADPAASRQWDAHFTSLGVPHLFLDADSKRAINLILPLLREGLAERDATFKKRGMRAPLYRLLVLGMPNVGKSTLINRLAGRSRLKTAPEPGVTRNVTWLNLLADSPGIMLPRLPDERTALKLGWIGAIRDSVVGELRLAVSLVDYLVGEGHGTALHAAYGTTTTRDAPPEAWLDDMALARGLLATGQTPDRHRAGTTLLNDFRAGSLGRFTLELAPSPEASP